MVDYSVVKVGDEIKQGDKIAIVTEIKNSNGSKIIITEDIE